MLLKVEHLVVSPAGFALRTGKLAFVLLAIMDIRAHPISFCEWP